MASGSLLSPFLPIHALTSMCMYMHHAHACNEWHVSPGRSQLSWVIRSLGLWLMIHRLSVQYAPLLVNFVYLMSYFLPGYFSADLFLSENRTKSWANLAFIILSFWNRKKIFIHNRNLKEEKYNLLTAQNTKCDILLSGLNKHDVKLE